MNPTLKKILGAIAIKEAVDKINEWRAPKKPSLIKRFGRLLLIGGAAGAGLYAYKSGALEPVMDKIKGKSSSPDSSRGAKTSASNGSGEGNDITFRSEDQPATAPVH